MGVTAWLSARTRGEVLRLMRIRADSGRSAWDELPWQGRQRHRDRLYWLNWLFAVLALALVLCGAFQAAAVLRQLRSGLRPPTIIVHQHRPTARGRLLWEARFSGVAVATVTPNGYVLARQTQGEFTAFWVMTAGGEVVWEHRVDPGAELPAVAITFYEGVTVVRLEEDRVHHFLLPSGLLLTGTGPPGEAFAFPATGDSAGGGYHICVSNSPGTGGGAARVWLYWSEDEALTK